MSNDKEPMAVKNNPILPESGYPAYAPTPKAVDCPPTPPESSAIQTTSLYQSLRDVLDDAYDQAAIGKGNERHAQGLLFDEQPMQQISELINSPDGMVYQLIKKAQESLRMEPDAAIRELHGVINYAAGVVIYLKKKESES